MQEYCVVWLLVVLHFFLPLYIEVGVGLLLASNRCHSCPGGTPLVFRLLLFTPKPSF